jgi:glycosyltransferase involved in cell wall biosynthesis
VNTPARPLRVAFFNAADRVSGAEALIGQTIEGLISRGVEARLYAMQCQTELPYVHKLPVFRGERFAEYKLRRLTGGNDLLFPSTLALGWRSWIKDADVWHFHNLHGHYVSIPLLAVQSRKHPVVLSPVDQYLSTGYCCYTMGCERNRQACGSCPQIRSMPYPGLRWDTTGALLTMKKAAVRRSKFNVLLHTDYLAQYYASTFVGSRPIDRIYYGVNTEVFRPLERDACAANFGLPPSKRFVVGLFHTFLQEERKGFGPLLELLTTLGDRMPGRIEVLVGGHGSERVRKYETPNLRVTALPFLERPEELAMALNLCDVLLYPTQAENLSLTCLDALACGTPVISSNVGGQPEAIRDGVNGFLCDPSRYDQFVQRVAQLASDPELTRQLSIGARETAVAKFDIRTYVDNLIGYYDQVIQRQG